MPIEAVLQRIGQRLRELRTTTGATQAATAEAVGLARSYLSAVEAGQKNITMETLCTLAAHFDVDPTELLRPDPPRPPAPAHSC